MPKIKNPKLGTIPCDQCGAPSSVKRNTLGNLYTGCQQCGPDMRKSVKLQTRLWNETTWLEGAKPTEPPKCLVNVAPTEKPSAVDLPKPTEKPKPEPKGKGAGGLMVMLCLCAVVVIKPMVGNA